MSNTIDRSKIDESVVIAWTLSGESMTLGEYMAPLRAQVATLQAAATAAEWGDWQGDDTVYVHCPICHRKQGDGHRPQCLYTAARAAGYLPAGEGVVE